MKIEVFVVDDIHEIRTGATCFEAPEHVRNSIKNCKPIQGIVLIDDVAIKFSFSCLGIDGDIYTDDTTYRLIVKHVVPLYVYKSTTHYQMAA